MGNNYKYKLGDKIKIYEIVKGKGVWKKYKLKEPINGIVTGYRTVYLGYTDGGYDEGLYFVQVGKVRVMEVTFDIYKKPYKLEIKRELYDRCKTWTDKQRKQYLG